MLNALAIIRLLNCLELICITPLRLHQKKVVGVKGNKSLSQEATKVDIHDMLQKAESREKEAHT